MKRKKILRNTNSELKEWKKSREKLKVEKKEKLNKKSLLHPRFSSERATAKKQPKCSKITLPWSASTSRPTRRPNSGNHMSDLWRVSQKFIEIYDEFWPINIPIGSEDIRANEGREEFRNRTPFTIYDDSAAASTRITNPGYRYLPVSRDTYGYSPRNIYSHSATRPGNLRNWWYFSFLN